MTIKRSSLVMFFAVVLYCYAFTGSAYAATGYAWIAGADDSAPYELSIDHSGTGWSWTAASNKLIIDNSYIHHIFIDCNFSDVINLEHRGDVQISKGEYGSAIVVNGSLNISGSGTLTLIPSELGTEYSIPTMRVSNNLTISEGTVVAVAHGELNRAIASDYGEITIAGNAKLLVTANGKRGFALYAYGDTKIDDNASLTAEGNGLHANGVIVRSGDIIIDSNATVRARGTGTGYALYPEIGSVTINSNNVTLIADDEEHFSSATPQGTGEVATEINKSNAGGGGSGGCNAGIVSTLSLLGFICVALRKK